MECIKNNNIGWILCVILLVFSNITVSSSTNRDIPSSFDSVRISLLTCSSHPEVYSLYGHTAIRYENKAEGQDYVINYGVFDFKDKLFVPKFTLGMADYTMGIIPYYYFENEYREYGSSITQQEINLTSAEKQSLSKALAKNYLPQNRFYRYNAFYKNCSTMARDMIINSIDGIVVFPNAEGNISFRDMIHSCNEEYPWARLGNDMLLGLKSDFNTTTEERHFLPENLKNDFEKAIVERDGKKYPLVKSTKLILQPGTQIPMEGFPLTPIMCSSLILLVCILLVAYEYVKHTITLWFDVIMMAVTGIAGILILLMFFSEHPTTSTNLLILMLNPIPLFFLHKVYKASKTKKICIWWKIWCVLSILTICLAAPLQDIDSSMLVIAIIIFIRALQHLLYERKMKLEK